MALPAAPAAARPASPEAEFLIAAHQGNLAQMTAGRIAVRKSGNPVIRKLGKRFAAYHRKLDAQVKATSETLAVRLPAEPNSEQQQLAEQYRAASPAAFDTLFVTTQLANYERAAKLAGTALKISTDPAIRAIVTSAAPAIAANRAALTAARDLLASEQPRQ
ncbi:hypothetical protein GCM10025331_85790 [Actinoplanes utahensis]|nr:hypothetical protein Aut01nite_85690 [Actinoplanes utahensis]